MSNRAYLFAEDTATPPSPLEQDQEPKANMLLLAEAPYLIPVFWLFCFEKGDVVEVDLAGLSQISGGSSREIYAVFQRLDEFHQLARFTRLRFNCGVQGRPPE